MHVRGRELLATHEAESPEILRLVIRFGVLNLTGKVMLRLRVLCRFASLHRRFVHWPDWSGMGDLVATSRLELIGLLLRADIQELWLLLDQL
jgi:hypothetical protein